MGFSRLKNDPDLPCEHRFANPERSARQAANQLLRFGWNLARPVKRASVLMHSARLIGIQTPARPKIPGRNEVRVVPMLETDERGVFADQLVDNIPFGNKLLW